MIGVSESQREYLPLPLKADLTSGATASSQDRERTMSESTVFSASTPSHEKASLGGNHFLVDLNEGSSDELEKLPGIGPTLAKRIVAYRRQNGKFLRLEDVGRVKGVGPVRLRQIRPHVHVDFDGSLVTEVSPS